MKGGEGLKKGTPSAKSGKYLTFVVGGEGYGVPVLNVREINRPCEATPVPQMPDHLQGVLNLRGKFIPVADLRKKLGFKVAENTEQTCIVEDRMASGEIGLIVHSAEEVSQIASGDIELVPDFADGIEAADMLAVAKVKAAVMILLDIDRVVAAAKTD